eukprot:12908205-Prorocentrum_lima.AAC.1
MVAGDSNTLLLLKKNIKRSLLISSCKFKNIHIGFQTCAPLASSPTSPGSRIAKWTFGHIDGSCPPGRSPVDCSHGTPMTI